MANKSTNHKTSPKIIKMLNILKKHGFNFFMNPKKNTIKIMDNDNNIYTSHTTDRMFHPLKRWLSKHNHNIPQLVF